MYVAHLTLVDFRSYAAAEVALEPGATAFIGRNGQGKTNLVEAIDYLARLGSHRVASDAPLVRAGAERALVRAAVVRDGRQAVLEIEINPGKANRARVNRADLPRARELVGLVRTVIFAPDDLALVKGDPAGRRAFLDDLLVMRAPRLAGVRADYERILKQRNSLLKTAGAARRGSTSQDSALSTLGVWDAHLARTGAELLAERLRLVEELRPYVGHAYATVRSRGGEQRDDAGLDYQPSLEIGGLDRPRRPHRPAAGRARGAAQRRARPRRLAGRSRTATSSCSPWATASSGCRCAGYASHGESWSFALALRLASYDLVRADGDDPILILDDVFAELDSERRAQLAELVAGAEQVLVTAAVAADVPEKLAGVRYQVAGGEVTRDELRRSRPPGRPTGPAGGPERERAAPTTGSTWPAPWPARPRARRPDARRRSAGPTGSPRTGRVSGAHPDDRDPQTLDAALTRMVDDHGWQVDLKVASMFARWADLVGARDRRAQPGRVVRRRQARGPHRLDRVGDASSGCSRPPSYAGSTRTSGTARSW